MTTDITVTMMLLTNMGKMPYICVMSHLSESSNPWFHSVPNRKLKTPISRKAGTEAYKIYPMMPNTATIDMHAQTMKIYFANASCTFVLFIFIIGFSKQV